MTTTVARSQLKLSLQYNGVTVPLVATEILYACNTIPQATVTLPIGRSVKTQQPADIAGVFNLGTELVKAQIMAEFSGQETDTKPWAAGQQVIFDGYIVGIGARQMRESVYVTLTLLNWMADLQFSSMLSQQLTPSQASPYGYSAVPPEYNPTPVLGAVVGKTVKETYYTTSVQMGEIIGDITDDVWAGIDKCLRAVAQQNLMGKLTEFASNLSPVIVDGNTTALAALDRIKSEGSLKLRAGTATASIASNMAKDMSSAPVREMLNSTFWDRIVGHHSASYLFTLIPRAIDTVAAPASPGLRTPYLTTSSNQYTILASDYDSIQSGGTFSQPLKSVIIPNMAGSNSNAIKKQVVQMSGCYTPDGANNSGRVLFCNPPRFMHGEVMKLFSPVAAAEKLAGMGANAPDSVTKDSGADTLRTRLTNSGEFLSLYAKSIYALEACRGINLSVSGRLRFDIAPGTLASVEGKSNEINGATGSIGKTHFGFVTSVSININAESNAANTSFKLSHARTEEQNNSDRFSITENPLYEKNWTGTWLVEAYK